METITLTSGIAVKMTAQTLHRMVPSEFVCIDSRSVLVHSHQLNVIPGSNLTGLVCYNAPTKADLTSSVALELISATRVAWKDEASKYGCRFASESVHLKEMIKMPFDRLSRAPGTPPSRLLELQAASQFPRTPAGVYVWSYEVTLPLDTPATWSFQRCQCLCYIRAKAGGSAKTRTKPAHAIQQLTVAAIEMPADPFRLEDFVRFDTPPPAGDSRWLTFHRRTTEIRIRLRSQRLLTQCCKSEKIS